jgi:hypothetical protein
MRSKKKGEVSQIFTYISTAIVIVIVLGFGIKWLSGLLGNVSEIECVQFKKDLELRIRNNMDYGKIDTRPLRVDCDFREVCFMSDPIFDKDMKIDESGTILTRLMNHSIEGNVKQNVFFINNIPESFFYLEKLVVTDNYLCFNVTKLGLNVRFEGQGNHVLLSKNV